jgi:predicted transposase/invertase (TIGR01784 family)
MNKNAKPELLEEVIKMDATIAKAQEKMDRISMSEEEMREYRMREKAELDYLSGMRGAEQRGIIAGEERGIKLGAEEAAKQIAREAKRFGLPIDQIAKITKLSAQEIEAL